ncbi:S1C family serine protease [Leptospira sp. GIMC2001]|uniref:S1C family serine protease n=1 Tax=Leptospira sp. GIMC2001 TaxID=1513297 RepID=UPI002349BB81|nr:trypsin-like peptidase domain-containing protein [Leptospira sp. GIMC2001]WCL48777.1 trypsin-like peptidase domain-containing protein [Leptospira sp. GIMC2001]
MISNRSKFINQNWILLLFFYPIFILNSQPNEGTVFNQVFQSVVLVKNESFLTESGTKPWMKESFTTGLGSGIIIAPNLVLTNAHVVMDSKFLTIRHYNKKKAYTAKIKHIATDCDLALLEVEDEDFNQGVKIFSFADQLPTLGSELLVLGYPNGTENLTVEKGNVLSLEKLRYSFSGLDFRNVIKIKASVFPGNSGGPAFQGDKIIGIAFQISKTGRDIAYLIPTTVIQHFLKDVEDGKYDGFPNLGFTYQSGYPSGIKEYSKIPLDTKGILLNSIYPKSSFFDYLKEQDYIYRVDDYFINNEGEVLAEKRVSLVDYIENKFVGDSVRFYFYRGGQKFKATANLGLTESLDLYREDSGIFYLNAGLVFQPLSRVFFSGVDPSLMDSSAKYHFSYFIQDKLYRFGERDILLSYVFDDPENFRNNRYKYKVLETINGYAPKDIKEFQMFWKRFHNEPILLKFRGIDLPIVLTPENIKKINTRVMKRYGVENELR